MINCRFVDCTIFTSCRHRWKIQLSVVKRVINVGKVSTFATTISNNHHLLVWFSVHHVVMVEVQESVGVESIEHSSCLCVVVKLQLTWGSSTTVTTCTVPIALMFGYQHPVMICLNYGILQCIEFSLWAFHKNHPKLYERENSCPSRAPCCIRFNWVSFVWEYYIGICLWLCH